ncbi:MAG TPA: hypothetical protein VH044_08295 [Polyangiaceae bacterium]|nr:hypothetical protein [Polyangiaceae bacterium]
MLNRRGSSACTVLFAATVVALAPSAHAQEPEAAPVPPPAPYSLPWQLRPAAATTGVRSDTSFARYEDAKSNGGFTTVSLLSASYKIPGTGEKWAGFAPLVRLAIVDDSPPSTVATGGGFAFVNPAVGGTYALDLGSDTRLAFFLGVTIPVGMGGGDKPDKGVADARSAGQFARSQMDDSLFAVNDLAVFPGLDFAWVHAGLTLQAEATLFQLWRVRGEKAQPEATKTNFTSGVHVGYFVVPFLSFGLDVRYQRWFNAPIAIDKDTTGTKIDNWTAAIGPRLHIPLGGSVKIHPGISYSRGLDKPMAAATPNYDIFQLDIPVTF